jgi:hypothetical protein
MFLVPSEVVEMKVLHCATMALALAGASGLAVAGGDCGYKDARLDMGAQMARSEAPKATPVAAKAEPKAVAAASTREDAPKVAQAGTPTTAK